MLLQARWRSVCGASSRTVRTALNATRRKQPKFLCPQWVESEHSLCRQSRSCLAAATNGHRKQVTSVLTVISKHYCSPGCDKCLGGRVLADRGNKTRAHLRACLS